MVVVDPLFSAAAFITADEAPAVAIGREQRQQLEGLASEVWVRLLVGKTGRWVLSMSVAVRKSSSEPQDRHRCYSVKRIPIDALAMLRRVVWRRPRRRR